MKTAAVRFGLIGCGAMGRVIVQHVLKKWKSQARWVGVHDVSRQAAQRLCANLKCDIPFAGLSVLISRSDWVVEAASPAIVPEVLRLCIVKKKNLLVMSSGGLLSCGALLKKASVRGIQILVPSGAIAGLDSIKAAGLGKIEEVSLTTRKPPEALAGAPYLMKNKIDLSELRGEQVVFEGSAAEAMAGFPANINVAATLTLAAGLNPRKTRVKIVADPNQTRNIHEIMLLGSTGSLHTRVENVPSKTNPKTSALAVLSACAAIDGIFSAVRIGT